MTTVLLVDDEPSLRDEFSAFLGKASFSVSTAQDGFDAILRLNRKPPDVVVSDLNMPHMSGFELLSVVRRRFPTVRVVAMSGDFMPGKVPLYVIADGFYAKGNSPNDLVAAVKAVIALDDTEIRTGRVASPVWIPRNGHDSESVPFVVLTCGSCLRSFPCSVPDATAETAGEVRHTKCIFCDEQVSFIIDLTTRMPFPIRKVVGG